MDNMMNQELWGNPLLNYFFTIGIISAAFLASIIGRRGLTRLAARRKEGGNKVSAAGFDAFADGLGFLAFAIAQVFAFDLLLFPGTIERFQAVTSDLILVLAIARSCWLLVRVPEAWLDGITAKSNSMSSMFGPMIRNCLRAVILILALLQSIQLVSNQDLTTILAGLGFGAAALALASQQSVSNFFGSVVLFINRPFDIGDRIVYQGNDGPIEEIGIMCTKQRTLEGHLVTIPNGKISGDVIRNIGKRPHIRQIHNITITYDTPAEKIEEALAIVKELLENHEGMNELFPPRVYFNNLNADSLNLLVIYWYHPPAYWDFLAFNEKLLLQIFKRFEAAGIDFAFPTQTLYLAGDEHRPLEVAFRKVSQGPELTE